MRTLRAWVMRLAGMLRSGRADREFARELESHLQHHIDDFISAGLSPAEARRRAVLALGGIEQTKERYRDRKGIPMIETLFRDLRLGARSLRKTPGFTLAAIVILGLGIGVNSAIFTVVNTVVLRPLPFPDADRVMRLWHTPPPMFDSPVFALSPANFVDWQEQSRSFERMAIYRSGRRILTGQGEPAGLIVGRVSSDFLPILGLTPLVGRGFTAEEDRDGGPKAVLLSEATWRTRFGGDAAVVGRPIVVDGEPLTVAGVVPNAPALASTVQLWIPLSWSAEERAVRNNHNYRAIAKLKPGVSVKQAQADLDAISTRLAQQYPADNKDWGALVTPLQEDLVGNSRSSLFVLLGAVGLVLLIACANLANLMLVRTHGRAKEIAVRTALGASRGRVVQQLLTEGLLLGIGGGAAGLAASMLGVRLLVAVFGPALPRAAEISLDGRVLAFTAAVALLTGLVAAFAPAWQLTRRDPNQALKQGAARGNSSAGDGRVRNLLVVSEVALALMLLVGAGLLMRSLAGLRAVDAGFDSRNLLTASVDIPEARYDTTEKRVQFFDRALQNIRALPGVESAAAVDTLPLQGGSSQPVALEGAAPVPEAEQPIVSVRMPTPAYFHTARVQFVSGRDFADSDALGRPLVAIISDGAAARLFPNENPIGRRLILSLMSHEPREVVGVVRDVKMDSLEARESQPAIYLPYGQIGFSGVALMVRTAVPPETLTRAVVGAVQALDPEQPLLDIQTMDAVVEESLGQRRFAMLLLGGFASLALLLAAVGIYSVLAYTVRQRVREIGIRMALGAPSTGVLRLIVVEGMKPTLAGVAIGLILAAALGRVLSTLLFGVGIYDVPTFTVVAVLVVLVGMVATLLPAYRATRVDPIVTLRAE
jgi:putative ABC transport system permease protein